MTPDDSISIPPTTSAVGAGKVSGDGRSIADDMIAGLPGEALVREGIGDCRGGRQTIAACLVAIAGSRLQGKGLLPAGQVLIPEPEIQLYRLLRQQGGDAYSRYNALIRELVSFESALDRQCRQSAE